jgi:hypothetical protein
MTADTFLTAYPEFTDTPVGVITDILANSEALIHTTAFGDFRNQAVKLLTAHRLALRFPVNNDDYLPANMPGAITSMDASNNSLSVQAEGVEKPDGSDIGNDYRRTTYGRELLSLIATQISPGRLA